MSHNFVFSFIKFLGKVSIFFILKDICFKSVNLFSWYRRNNLNEYWKCQRRPFSGLYQL